MTIELSYLNDDGDEIQVELPSKKEVCGCCNGEGFVLCEGMRGHAYTREEFDESFDDDEKEEYFKSGGRYDVKCPECNGKNVIDVVDEDKLTAEQREQYEAICRAERIDAEYDAVARAERRMGA